MISTCYVNIGNVKCPFCASDLSKVVDKRSVTGRGEIRRRRQCLKCDKRFTTYESLAQLQLAVLKKDGTRQAFDGEKIRRGLIRALEKRPGIEKVGTIVDRIEGRIRARRLSEIESATLGKWVLSELKKLDAVAYLRYVSVYRSFGDLKDFSKELETL